MLFKRQQDSAIPLAGFRHVSRRGTVFGRGCSQSAPCRATAHSKPGLTSRRTVNPGPALFFLLHSIVFPFPVLTLQEGEQGVSP